MKPMKNIFFVFILLIATSALADGPTTVYGWVSSDGVESFTDNDKAVPAKYLDQGLREVLGDNRKRRSDCMARTSAPRKHRCG
jgi:hypothetical protein